jgi:GTP-binding protein Era
MEVNPNHKAGFVSIIGKPNAGKSTLMNQLVGERLSIVTHKVQTTRHRIMGIINSPDYQIVYSDTPGLIDNPAYKLQKHMMDFVRESLSDADILLMILDSGNIEKDQELPEKYMHFDQDKVIILNKVDLLDQDGTQEWVDKLEERYKAPVIPLSALHGFNIQSVMEAILHYLPEHPPFFSKDQLTDKPERFFVTETIREKLLLNLKQEVPYSAEVVVNSFKEEEDIIRIRAVIYVERDSQKGIVIGKGGAILKKIGTEARNDLEQFFQKKIFLEQHVKVDADWRKDDRKLKRFGYKN